MAKLDGSTFLESGTISVTGGSTKTLVSAGGSSSEGRFYINEDTDSATRRIAKTSVKTGTANKSMPGGYNQDRATLALQQPKVLADASRGVNQCIIDLKVFPETTDAERLKLLEEAIQIALNGDDLFTRGNPL